LQILKLLLVLLIINTFLYASEENPTQEEVAKLYVATFNRAPDAGGLAYWTNESFGGNPTLSNIAQSFFDQSETQILYPLSTLNRDFILAVYQNLFNREPDTDGWNYWEEELNSKAISKNEFILAVINGALDNDDGMDATTLTNKTTVGLSFAEAGLEDVDDARTIMSGVTDNYSTVTDALASFGISLYESQSTLTILFSNDVMPVLENKCLACHKPGGINEELLITDTASTYTNIITNNYTNTVDVDSSLLLSKSIGINHGGGTILGTEDIEYQTLKDWITQGVLNN